MNIVFAGTPDFAVPSLQALAQTDYPITAVYTQPDRHAGRGRKLQTSAVKQLAEKLGLNVVQPLSLKTPEAHDRLAALAPDLMVVIAYGQILPQAILDIPRLGCINVHASLLPRWRGAAPIARAIEAGDASTGVTIMQMDAGLDTGPMLRWAETPIHDDDTAASLQQRLAQLGAQQLLETLVQLERGTLKPEAQPQTGVSYAHKLQKHEAAVDWSLPAAVLHRKIRAFNPWPVASTHYHNNKLLRLWGVGSLSAAQDGARLAAGSIISADRHGILVQTGTGALRLTQLQAEGGKVLQAGQFLNGHRLQPGDILQ